MKRIEYIAPVFFLLLFLNAGNAQRLERQVIGSMGGVYQGSNLNVHFTVGETVVKSVTDGSFYINQGFQQGGAEILTSTTRELIPVKYKLYPNPASHWIKIELSSEREGNVQMEILDVTGKVVRQISESFSIGGEQGHYVDLAAIPAGTYFVMIRDMEARPITSIEFLKME